MGGERTRRREFTDPQHPSSIWFLPRPISDIRFPLRSSCCGNRATFCHLWCGLNPTGDRWRYVSSITPRP